jgi:hypothetical protein
MLSALGGVAMGEPLIRSARATLTAQPNAGNPASLNVQPQPGTSLYGIYVTHGYNTWTWSAGSGGGGTIVGGDGDAEIRLSGDLGYVDWEVYILGALVGSGRYTSGGWESAVWSGVRLQVAYRYSGADFRASCSEFDLEWAWDEERNWPWDSTDELSEWTVVSGTPEVASGELRCAPGVGSRTAVVLTEVSWPWADSAAVVQAADGTLYCAVGTHGGTHGMGAYPTVRLFRRFPVSGMTWEQVPDVATVIATPAQLGGDMDGAIWSGVNRPGLEYYHGAAAVTDILEMPSGRLVIAIAKIGNVELQTDPVTRSAWGTIWAVSDDLGRTWTLADSGLVGKVVDLELGADGAIYAHMIEGDVDGDVDQGRDHVVKLGPDLVVVKDDVLELPGTPGEDTWEADAIGMDRCGGGVWFAGPVGELQATVWSMLQNDPPGYYRDATGMVLPWEWVERPLLGGYMEGMSVDEVYRQLGIAYQQPPGLCWGVDGRLHVIWRGYTSYAPADSDLTSLWYYALAVGADGGAPSILDAVYCSGPPVSRLATLSHRTIINSKTYLHQAPDGALHAILNAWHEGRLLEYVSRDNGLLWVQESELVW